MGFKEEEELMLNCEDEYFLQIISVRGAINILGDNFSYEPGTKTWTSCFPPKLGNITPFCFLLGNLKTLFLKCLATTRLGSFTAISWRGELFVVTLFCFPIDL